MKLSIHRKRINYQAIVNDDRDLLKEIEQLTSDMKNIENDIYYKTYREIEKRVITENGCKVIYCGPTA